MPGGELALVLAGQEYGRWERLRAQARGLGLGDRVRHVGQLPPATLAALYRRAAAVVVPSLHEGFGFPALEAMACGCPVAHSGRGALGELPSGAAVTFDPLDADSIAGALARVTEPLPDLEAIPDRQRVDWTAVSHDRVRRNAIAFLDGDIAHLWPNACGPRWQFQVGAPGERRAHERALQSDGASYSTRSSGLQASTRAIGIRFLCREASSIAFRRSIGHTTI